MTDREKRLMDAYLDGEVPKIKTPFAEIIVKGTAEKPYYNIIFYDPGHREYEVCFGSYYLENVRKWLLEEFEIVDEPTVDAVEVVHGRWLPYHEADIGYDEYGIRCSNCRLEFEDHEVNFPINYCPNCGAKMDGDGNGN